MRPPIPPELALPEPNAVRPVIVVDTREQDPLPFRRLAFATGTLTSGDYSFQGAEHAFSVERKNIADLVSCCVGDNRQRFERELHRLRGFQFKRLLVVGCRAEIEQHRYRSSIAPKVITSTLAAFEVRYDCPVVWAISPDEAGQFIEGWAFWFAREIVKQARHLAQAPAA
jgi:DNA excision repair protein ERCC-4